MFTNRTKIKKEMIGQLRPTSKAALKHQCLIMAEGDVDKAERLYDFMIKDMDDLPTFDVVPPSTMQQVKDGAIGTMNWIKENKDDIMDWVGFLRGMFAKGGNAPTGGSPLPPING